MYLEVDLDPELIPPHDLRWELDWTGAGEGVDLEKVQPKYVSGARCKSGVDPPKNWPQFGTHMVIKNLRW